MATTPDPDRGVPVKRLQLDASTGKLAESPKAALFLRGPIPLDWLGSAATLPGKTLHIGIALWWLHGMAKGKPFKLTQKAGVDGRLFGSVTNHDIADELKKHGFDVHKSQVRLPNGPIKVVGDNTVQVSLHTDVDAEITVSVYGETA